jgi:Kef-type K+ transport system membrane component KefB
LSEVFLSFPDTIIEALQGSLFYQLAFILISAGLLGFIALKLRQPLIVAFIALGILVSPSGLNIIAESSEVSVDTLAALGITLLLFMVGLKLDLNLIKTMRSVALAAGLVQVLLSVIFGFLICLQLGYDFLNSLMIGIAISFSSTIIVVKMLSDQRAIDSLHGRISIGVLIVQDIIVIVAMVVMAGVASESARMPTFDDFTMILLKISVLVLFTGIFINYLAEPVTRSLSRSPELTVIFAIGLAATFAGIAFYLGLSKELGGLLAGISLASTNIREELVSRLSPVRDFLLIFFFVNMGTHLELSSIGGQIPAALILSAFVLLGKPLIIVALTIAFGYRLRTGFMGGLALAQISEFSLIFISMAMDRGLVEPEVAGLMTFIALITFGLSTYGIMYGVQIFHFLEHHFGYIKLPMPRRYEELIQEARTQKEYDVIIIGMGRYGSSIARQLKFRGLRVLGVDFNPDAIRNAQHNGITTIHGDASNPDLAHSLPLSSTRAVVCAIPLYSVGPMLPDIRQVMAKSLRSLAFKGKIVVTSQNPETETYLKQKGIDIILGPFHDAALNAVEKIYDLLETKLPEQKP